MYNNTTQSFEQTFIQKLCALSFFFFHILETLSSLKLLIQLHVEHRERIICVAKLSLAKPLSSPSVIKTF